MKIKREDIRIESIDIDPTALEQKKPSFVGSCIVGIKGVGAAVSASVWVDYHGNLDGIRHVEWQEEGIADIAYELDSEESAVFDALGEVDDIVFSAIAEGEATELAEKDID